MGLIDNVKNRFVRVSDRLDEVDRKRSKGHDDESEDPSPLGVGAGRGGRVTERREL